MIHWMDFNILKRHIYKAAECTISCSEDSAGSGGNSCFGGRTTVGMMRLWRDVSSSVASSRIYNR